jgi:sugar-specific transcriptional regulator TrmB
MKDELIQLGLTEREAEAYTALTSFKEATALELAKLTKEHRTNIYDSLEGLIKKGLIAYSIKLGVKHYSIPDGVNIVNFLAQKEALAQEVANQVNKKKNNLQEKPIVEVYEGKEGFKSILWKILREGKTLYSIGASEEWNKRFPFEIIQYMKEREKRKIRAKLLYVKGTKPIISKLNEIRFLPVEFSQPSTIAFFGEYVATFMWTEPMVATLTKSRDLSSSFRNYFEVLWKRSKACHGKSS